MFLHVDVVFSRYLRPRLSLHRLVLLPPSVKTVSFLDPQNIESRELMADRFHVRCEDNTETDLKQFRTVSSVGRF
jgi:hypothetical protein